MLTVLFGLRCWSNIGREYSVPGAQELSIGEGCNTKGIITHELMHALGFWHEQSRTDRDDYIAVLWENIKKGSNWSINKNATLVTGVVKDDSDKLVSWPLVVLKVLVMLSCIIYFEIQLGKLTNFFIVSTYILWDPFIDPFRDASHHLPYRTFPWQF